MNKQLLTLRALNMFYFATNAILTPFLPVYFAEKGYSSSEIGLLMMFGPFVAIFAQPLWGYLSDRYHKLKLIIFVLWSLSVMASVGVFMLDGFTYSFVFMLLLNFFLLPSNPLLDSIVIKTTLQAGVPYGTVRMFGSLGFTLVAMSSGFILAKLGGVHNIPYLYWGLWVMPLLLLLLLRDERSGGTRITLRSFGSVMGNKPFLWFLVMIFILTVPHRMNDVLAGLYLKELGASDSMLGWAWALAALSEVPTFALLGRYLHRFHELALLSIVAVLYTVRWLLYYAISDPFLIMLLQASHCITYAVFWIVSVQYAVRLVPEELRSTGQSLLSAVFLGLAGITGGTIGGLIQDRWGGQYMYAFGAVLTLLAALLLIGTHVYMRKGTKKPSGLFL
ncbi:MFS transporter [Paenibacillus thalictri]|uniref:MFS transporter n=2 Tax=Paenibacillus thalictri TaxID=2527873 RepID=A0A4Q9E1G4_9BACL|nr:MFS transporter [Paenibacillus thalictri]